MLGNSRATDTEISKAIKIACFAEVIEKLPNGLNYKLGSLGTGLSGGEKQRLAIARAVLQNRPILVLDEATTGLDYLIKQRVLDNLAEYACGRVMLAISHDELVRRWATQYINLSPPTKSTLMTFDADAHLA